MRGNAGTIDTPTRANGHESDHGDHCCHSDHICHRTCVGDGAVAFDDVSGLGEEPRDAGATGVVARVVLAVAAAALALALAPRPGPVTVLTAGGDASLLPPVVLPACSAGDGSSAADAVDGSAITGLDTVAGSSADELAVRGKAPPKLSTSTSYVRIRSLRMPTKLRNAVADDEPDTARPARQTNRQAHTHSHVTALARRRRQLGSNANAPSKCTIATLLVDLVDNV